MWAHYRSLGKATAGWRKKCVLPRRAPRKIVQFLKNILEHRVTQLKFDDHISEYIKLYNRIGQGDSLSMINYQYYNADLLDAPEAPN